MATRRPAEDDDAHNPFGGGGGGGTDKSPKSLPPPDTVIDPFAPTPGEAEDDFMHDLEDGREGSTRDV